jgi:hypothetical protein
LRPVKSKLISFDRIQNKATKGMNVLDTIAIRMRAYPITF